MSAPFRVWVSGHLQPGMVKASAAFRRLPKLKKKLAARLQRLENLENEVRAQT
jgi:hypothetical protein